METMQPSSTWDAAAHREALETFEANRTDITIRIWGGDWCSECQALLPAFAAALETMDLSGDRIELHPVEKRVDGSKTGPLVEEYGIEWIPTVVVERDGEELARFVEDEGVPIVVYLAEQIEARTATS